MIRNNLAPGRKGYDDHGLHRMVLRCGLSGVRTIVRGQVPCVCGQLQRDLPWHPSEDRPAASASERGHGPQRGARRSRALTEYRNYSQHGIDGRSL